MGLTYTFQSTDTGMAGVTNAAGQLITVLDACLVNGYNTKTVTITRSGTTATLNCTTHNFRDGQILVVAGADQADYNIEARCTRIDANNVSIQVANSPATPATGTITAMVAPLGWTKAYSGTNLAAYKSKSGTNGFYLRVDDSAAGDALLRGYEAMTAISTGTGPFPTVAQSTNGLNFYKSADATARPWRIWSDGKIIYMINLTNQTTWVAGNGSGFAFGDFVSYKSGDAYNTCLNASTTAAGTGGSADIVKQSATAGGAAAGFYVARSAAQTGTAYQASKMNGSIFGSGSYVGQSTYLTTYPDPVHGGLNLAPVYVGNDTSYGVRGYLQGWWGWMHTDSYTHGDTFSGATGTDIEGRTFEQATQYSANSKMVFETSDTWGL